MTLLPACEKGDPRAPVQAAVTDTATDEQAIRAAIARWHQLLQSRNAEAIALLFAEDGELMAPGQAGDQWPRGRAQILAIGCQIARNDAHLRTAGDRVCARR